MKSKYVLFGNVIIIIVSIVSYFFMLFFSFVLFNFMLFWWSICSGDDTNLNLSYECSVKNLNFFSHSSHSMAIDGTGLPVYSHKNSKSHVYCPSMIWVGDSLRSTLNLPNHEMSSILQISTCLGSSWFTTNEKGRHDFIFSMWEINCLLQL